MKRISLALSCASLVAVAAPAVAAPTVVTPPSAALSADLASAKRSVVERATRAMLLDAAWLTTDPAFAGASDVSVRATRVSGHMFARATPIVAGARVEGADRVVVIDERGVRHVEGKGAALTPIAAFAVPAHEATLAATQAVKVGLFVDATVERTAGLAQRVWLSVPAGLRPAWRVRVPTLRLEDLSDVYIDGTTGVVIKRVPVARFGEAPSPSAARVFEFAPAAGGLAVGDLEDVTLEGLRPGLAVGDFLRGDHFETANCCKMIVCNEAGVTNCLNTLGPGEVALDVARCATQQDIDDGIAVESVIQPPNGIPSSTLPIPAQFASFVPDPLFVKVSFCAEIPRATLQPATADRGEGWFFDPIDVNARAGRRPCYAPSTDTRQADPQGCASEEEPFAEVQVFHASQTFFAHIRDVLDDQTFCLGGQSQECNDDGTPVLGDDGEPTRAFHVAANVMFPNLDFNALITQVAPPPLGQGKGATAGNPVVIDDFGRLPNAAFVPALEGGPIQIPPELQAIASLFNRPFDSNIYFQGGRDFAYDGDVVAHELTHGIVHSFVPQLASLGRDRFGAHAESGALNEGWADYFSSSFLGDPSVGDYAGQGLSGETGIRNNENDRACPDDTIGQVHNDSEAWAGALWAIREQHLATGGQPIALDRAVLAALALADDDEDMTRAAGRVVNSIRTAFGAAFADFAVAEFDARGVTNCFRVWPLATLNADATELVVTRKDQLVQPGPQEIGTSNFAPSVLQFRVDVPAGSAGFTLTWSQTAGGGGLGGGGEPPNMAVAVIEVPTDAPDAAIEWRYEGNAGDLAVPYDHTGAAANFNETAAAVTLGAANQQTGAQSATFTHTLTSDPCNARSFVFSIVALGGGANLANIDVDNIPTDAACEPAEGEGEGEGEGEPPEGCSCSGGSAPPTSLALFGLALVALRRRR